MGPFIAFDITAKRIERLEIDPQEFGLARCASGDLAGGDAVTNLAALTEVFEGKDRGAHLDTLALQSGLALTIAGRVPTIAAGIALARDTVRSGKAQAWLTRLKAFANSRGPAT
jgi:anthranilate phosphoribosyltransferase